MSAAALLSSSKQDSFHASPNQKTVSFLTWAHLARSCQDATASKKFCGPLKLCNFEGCHKCSHSKQNLTLAVGVATIWIESTGYLHSVLVKYPSCDFHVKLSLLDTAQLQATACAHGRPDSGGLSTWPRLLSANGLVALSTLG